MTNCGNIPNMKNPELSNQLLSNGHGISVEELLCSRYNFLLHRGLRVLTLCNDGTGRSDVVATKLNQSEIPTVRLSGGLKQFTENQDLYSCIPSIQSAINECPNVAVILTPEEVNNYYAFLSNLRCIKYPNSNSAIQSLIRMES